MTPSQMLGEMRWAIAFLVLAVGAFVCSIVDRDVVCALVGCLLWRHSDGIAWRVREEFAVRYGMTMTHARLQAKQVKR